MLRYSSPSSPMGSSLAAAWWTLAHSAASYNSERRPASHHITHAIYARASSQEAHCKQQIPWCTALISRAAYSLALDQRADINQPSERFLILLGGALKKASQVHYSCIFYIYPHCTPADESRLYRPERMCACEGCLPPIASFVYLPTFHHHAVNPNIFSQCKCCRESLMTFSCWF